MKYFSGSKEAHNWRSWWMPIVIANPLSSTQLPSCLMVVDSVESKLLMRYLSHTTCSCTQLHIHKIIDIKLTHILPFIFSSFCSWTWRMGMRSMLCCTKLVVLWKQVINAWWRANLLGHAVVVGSWDCWQWTYLFGSCFAISALTKSFDSNCTILLGLDLQCLVCWDMAPHSSCSLPPYVSMCSCSLPPYFSMCSCSLPPYFSMCYLSQWLRALKGNVLSDLLECIGKYVGGNQSAFRPMK